MVSKCVSVISSSRICIHYIQPSQVGSLFTFLARQGAKHRASIRVDEHIYDQVNHGITYIRMTKLLLFLKQSNNYSQILGSIFAPHPFSIQVLEYITHAEEDVVNEERQQVMLESCPVTS